MKRPSISERVRRVVVGTASGVPRYSREILASLQSPAQSALEVEHEATTSAAHSRRLEALLGSSLGAMWVGHATVLIRLGSFNILTDPVFSRRIGMTVGGVGGLPAMTVGLGRIAPAALDISSLPPLDLILLSHAHFDHLDRPSLKRLAEGPGRGARVITAGATKSLIPKGLPHVQELGWNTHCTVRNRRQTCTITALRPSHWGARTTFDQYRRFNSYLIESGGKRVFFAGDTAQTDAFDRLGAVDLSIFGIGAYDPWEGAHATPEQVWSMYTRMAGRHTHGPLLPMHHSTFVLGREPLHEPMLRLIEAAGSASDLIAAHRPGDLWLHP